MNGILAITGQDSPDAELVQITGIDTSDDSDTILVTHSGAGAALKIISSEADTQLLELVSAANQTTWLQYVDGDTAEWIGADDVGMVTLAKGATALAHAGSTALLVTNASKPAASAEGFMARFVDTGTTTASTYAVQISTTNKTGALSLNNKLNISGADESGTLLNITHVGAAGNADAMTMTTTGSGDAIQITPGDTDSGGINVVGKAAGTVPLLILDGKTNNWDGADNVGMINITQDTAFVHAGASSIIVLQETAVKSDAEGFLARFISTATRQPGAFAVEIEVPAQQPALKINGTTEIVGQDDPCEVTFQVTGLDTTGDEDAMTIVHSGAGDCLQI